MAAPAEAIVAPAKTDENLVHTDVTLFNRWSYDDVEVIFLNSPSICVFTFVCVCVYNLCFFNVFR